MDKRLHVTRYLRGWRHDVARRRVVNERLCVAQRLIVDGGLCLASCS